MKKTITIAILFLVSAPTISAMIETAGGGAFHELKQYQKLSSGIKKIACALWDASQDWTDALDSGQSDSELDYNQNDYNNHAYQFVKNLFGTLKEMANQQTDPRTWTSEDPVGEIAKETINNIFNAIKSSCPCKKNSANYLE